MTTFMIVMALAAVMLFSAAASQSDFQRSRLSWYKWFFLFLSSSFLGCLFEMAVVWLDTGILMSRSSLLYGAFSVVWGLGALLMTSVLFPLRRYGRWAVFAGGAVLGGGFEYLASLFLELAYHRLFWDYSHIPLNLDGRTNLLYAAFWGLAGIIWIDWMVPTLLRLLEKIPPKGGQAVAAGLAILLAFDIGLSAAAFWRMDERSRGQLPSNSLEVMLDTWYDDRTMQQRYQNMVLSGTMPKQK
ncbi:putative ABC transporter permease [Flavonifractor sp. AGMB03687]|uniref:putative ABC transporter permease n=1 Tax=Flavonifractor sp. AGMB03687 TaxID=2785133 RepID=UPI001AE08870|nr:putative ABC transporter permease [Flavonifractor sp. AGMB03687]